MLQIAFTYAAASFFLAHTHTDTHVRPLRRPLCFIAKGAA